MNVTPPSDVTAAGEASASTSTAAAQAELSEEFTQFLSLLTAQVENQDPLSPLDSTAFVEQLATFSSLEQQVQTNSLLKDILAAVDAA